MSFQSSFFTQLLGVSNQTWNPINPPNLANSAQEPSDPTLATIGGMFAPPKPKTSGLVDGFEHENPIFNQPDQKIHRKSLFSTDQRVHQSDFVRFIKIQRDLIQIWPDLFKIYRDLVKISPNLFEIRRDLVKISPNLFKIQPDLIEISLDLFKIQPNLVEIHQDLFEIRSDPTKTSRFRKNSADFCKFRQRFSHLDPDQKLVTFDHPNRCLRQVGSGSKYQRPEVNGLVLGQAQTPPGPTRGQAQSPFQVK